MKIAYSCAGEGFGHAARMVVLAGHLAQKHDLSCWVPREVEGFIREKLGCFDSRRIPVLAFAKNGDRVNLPWTVIQNAPTILSFPFRAAALAKTLKTEGFDCVISDFEPLMAWAGKLAGIPVLQMNHPGIIARYPGKTLNSFFSILGARLMEGPWDSRILVSFFGGDVGPLLRPSLFKYPVQDGGYLLLNLKPSYREPVLKILKQIPGLDIRVFPAPGQNFEEALAGCRAVISPAGHQIIAECLALGKPLLVLPQKGQYEQALNARMLQSSGRGMCGSLATLKQDLGRFLTGLPFLSHAAQTALPKDFRIQDGTAELLVLAEGFLDRARQGSCQPQRKQRAFRSIAGLSPAHEAAKTPGTELRESS